MAKLKTAFFCQHCGTSFAKWQGQCHVCKSWNSIVEEVVQKPEKVGWQGVADPTHSKPKPLPVSAIDTEAEIRLRTSDAELNRVLGGGLVAGSVTLLGGEPGIGKSTLLLQIALQLPCKTLYVSGEESQKQIKMRADRMPQGHDHCYILTETQTQAIFTHIRNLQPEVVIIDSIQTLQTELIESSAGSVSQIRECAAELIHYAKQSQVPVILIGHITKEGTLAGPKILEHMVDTVLQFEGDRNHAYRLLRAHKNRFGSTSELGIYEMAGSGLREVADPSGLLLTQRDESVSGTAVGATLEGMRPLLVEVQALVSSAVYGTPQRSTTGFNAKRLNMLLAVLEKRAGFKLGTKDVFLNITGGLNLDDPAIDLAVVAAILSSDQDIPLPEGLCFAGEVGLSGEVRPVTRIDQRISEAEKLGFTHMVISKYSAVERAQTRIKITEVGQVLDVARLLLG